MRATISALRAAAAAAAVEAECGDDMPERRWLVSLSAAPSAAQTLQHCPRHPLRSNVGPSNSVTSAGGLSANVGTMCTTDLRTWPASGQVWPARPNSFRGDVRPGALERRAQSNLRRSDRTWLAIGPTLTCKHVSKLNGAANQDAWDARHQRGATETPVRRHSRMRVGVIVPTSAAVCIKRNPRTHAGTPTGAAVALLQVLAPAPRRSTAFVRTPKHLSAMCRTSAPPEALWGRNSGAALALLGVPLGRHTGALLGCHLRP